MLNNAKEMPNDLILKIDDEISNISLWALSVVPSRSETERGEREGYPQIQVSQKVNES